MAFVVNPAGQTLDILRIVEYPYRGGAPVTVLDLHNNNTYALVANTFKIAAPERRQQFSDSSRRYGGAKLSQETHGNGQISAEWYVKGTTKDHTMELTEELLKQIECVDKRSPRYIAWQPSGTSRPVLYRIVGPAQWDAQYRWVEFQQTRAIHLAAGVLIAPMAEGLPMFIADKFDIDSIADYTVEVGTASDITISGGNMHTTANFGTDHDLIYSDRNYVYGDAEGTARINIGTTMTGIRAGVILKGKDSQNKLRVYFNQTGALATLKIATVISGTEAVLTTLNLPGLYSAGDVLHVRGWVEKNRIYAGLWSPGNAPEAEPDYGTATTLNSTNSGLFGYKVYGRPGIYLRAPDATATVEEYSHRTFHYKGGASVVNQTVPTVITLDGDVPGTAPAKTDLDVILSAAAVEAPFAMVSWVPEFGPWNMIFNGDFEDDTDGWSVAAHSVAGAATSITRITADKYRGVASAQVNIPATLQAGAHFKIYRTFRRGVTYTAKVRVKATSGSPSVSAGVGWDFSNSAGSGATTISSTAWTELTATWLSNADYDDATFWIRSETATAMNLIIDTVRVYAGTTEATTLSQTDGRGGAPPFGVIKAMNRDHSRSGGWTTPAETATYIHNNTFISGALEFVVDPLLIPADDFTDGETSVEVWARMSVNDAPVLVTTFAQPGNLAISAGARYSNEFGSAGKWVEEQGSSGTDWRTVRCGTLNLKPIYGDAARWRIRLGLKTKPGLTANLKVEEIYLTPIKRRALTPTGKPIDAAYPEFISSTTGQKRIYSDLRGAATSLPSTGFYPDSGLGGEFIELDPGSNRLFVKLSDKVPDDPSAFAAAETSPINARIYLDVTPRYFLGRG